jgi:hypothetical protein
VIPKGAFIAGVQAQMIAVTYTFSSTALYKATNWFGFMGLILDLVGASTGVVHALWLQQAIRHTDRIAVRLTSLINGARQELQVATGPGLTRSDPQVLTSLELKIEAISRVIDLLRIGHISLIFVPLFQAFAALYTVPILFDVIPEFELLNLLGRGTEHADSAALNLTQKIFTYVVQGIGAPVASLAGGTLCLLVSVILFAGASQPPVVWISCIAIAVSMFTLSIISTTMVRSKSMPAVPALWCGWGANCVICRAKGSFLRPC